MHTETALAFDLEIVSRQSERIPAKAALRQEDPMRTKALLLVALLMMMSCSNVEPAQSEGASGAGGVANVGTKGDETTSVGGASSSAVSKASSDTFVAKGGSSAKPVAKGGTSSKSSAMDGGGGADSQDPSTGGVAKSGSSKSSKGSTDGSSTGGTKSTGKTSGSKSSSGTGSTSGNGGASANGGASNTPSTADVGCDRAGLQAAVDAYLAALESADTSKMPLTSSVKYTEVTVARGPSVALGDGLWKAAQPVSFSRSLLDVTGCETFTEVFITESSHPYVLGTRLAIEDGKISEIYTIATDEDDWNFDAKAYATCSESEDWSVLPEASRSTREVLIAAGQAYFDIFSDKSTEVPWGNPCYRLEGGKQCTPQIDKASTTCNVGIPDGITFKDTHWVVDEDIGAVVGITLFAGASPDTHLFRLVGGKIRYVHTLTVMN